MKEVMMMRTAMAMAMGSVSTAGAPSLVHFNTLPSSFWPPHSASTHWPLSPLSSFSASPFNTPCQINAGSGMNVLEGKQSVLEGADRVLEADDSDDFVEVGLIRNTHGIRGEVKVSSRTDFPEQRFEKPGIRWVGYYRSGKFVGIHEIELLSGRKIIQGKESAWLLTFRGFDTLEKAAELIGATVLVKNADRPMLSADQLYIPELIGMSVQLKDSGKVIGNIVDIFNSGASDLLRVKLQPRENVGGRDDDSLVWIPFVEEIVPVVDQQARMVQIVPPEGLLELNLPSKKPLKQELRKQALKTKRKLQERMSGVRKKVQALKQAHILSGLTLGDESQRETLKTQLLGIDFSSFKRAIETSLRESKPSLDSDAFAFASAIASSLDWKGLKDWLEASPKELECSNKVKKLTWKSWLQGLELVANGRVAVVALPTGEPIGTDTPAEVSLESNLECQAGQLLAIQELAKMITGGRPLIPWVVAITEDSAEYIKNLLKDEAYFGLAEGQVHFIKMSCLPYISRDEEEGVQRILMESEWRIVAGAGGDGQVISDLDDSGVLNNLIGMGIHYIHVCSLDNSSAMKMDPAIFGFMKEQKACIALKVTSEALKGDHGILCLQKGSVDGRSRSTFISALGEAAEVRKNSAIAFEHYAVLNSGESMKADIPALKDDELIYRVPSSCNYTLSAEYLSHLSQQRHRFIYEAESLLHKESSEDNDVKNEPHNAIQFKCSLHNALLFCSPSKVALLKYDNIV